jgi:protein-tyrosine kinase
MSRMYEALKKAQQDGVATDLLDVVEPARLEPHLAAPEKALGTSTPSHLAPGQDSPRAVANEFVQNSNGNCIRHLPLQVPERSVVLPWEGTDGRGGEQYRIIRTRIVQHPKQPRLMLISSAGAGDGKTVSAINIAGVLSLRDNANVLLIDGDFRRGGVSSLLGLPAEPGLANTLSGSCPLQDAIIRVEQFPNLYILPAGAGNANPAELLDTEQWKSLCSTVRERFSFVIIDGPPVAAVADYELIQASCDGVIVVVRPEHTDRTLFNKAFELIPEGKKVGVVLNCAYEWFLWKTHESYYYNGSRGKQAK